MTETNVALEFIGMLAIVMVVGSALVKGFVFFQESWDARKARARDLEESIDLLREVRDCSAESRILVVECVNRLNKLEENWQAHWAAEEQETE